MRSFAEILVTVVVALGVLAGCGSSSKPLSKADFIARADKICTQTATDSKAATKGLKHPTAEQIVDATKLDLVPLLQRQDKELAKLKPPVADRAVVTKFLDQEKAVTADIDKNTTAFVQSRGVSALATEASKQAQAYGFKVCAKIGTS